MFYIKKFNFKYYFIKIKYFYVLCEKIGLIKFLRNIKFFTNVIKKTIPIGMVLDLLILIFTTYCK